MSEHLVFAEPTPEKTCPGCYWKNGNVMVRVRGKCLRGYWCELRTKEQNTQLELDDLCEEWQEIIERSKVISDRIADLYAQYNEKLDKPPRMCGSVTLQRMNAL